MILFDTVPTQSRIDKDSEKIQNTLKFPDENSKLLVMYLTSYKVTYVNIRLDRRKEED